jgi:regulatory protein
MPTITALELQKKDNQRVSVFLDGAFAFGVSIDVAVTLKKGQVLTAAEVEALQLGDERNRAYQRALGYLAARPHSRVEVERYLRGKHFDDDAVTYAIQQLLEHGYLDDEAFAQFWQENRSQFRPRSAAALRYELRQKGVDSESIDAAVHGMDEEEVAWSAATAKAGRWANLAEDAFEKKMMAFLARRGFGYEIARRVTRRAWAEIHNPHER